MIAQISVMMLTDYEDKDMIGLYKAVLQTLEFTGLSVVAEEYIPILEEAAEISARGSLRLGTIITSLLARGELYNLAEGKEAAITSALEQSTHYHFHKVESSFGRVHE
eukprot:scaffold3023_cov193-Chaetoceros_neogracile.AAC.1